MHACHQVAGIPNDAKVTVEQFIAAVSPFLLDALRRSPDVVAYILDSE